MNVTSAAPVEFSDGSSGMNWRLVGGDFDGALVKVPYAPNEFYVYSGDIINVYAVGLENVDGGASYTFVANFLLDETATEHTIPSSMPSVELIWDEDNQVWKQ